VTAILHRRLATVHTPRWCSSWLLVAWLGLAHPAGAQAPPVPRFEDTLAQRLLACTGCHGPQGRSAPDGYHPRIAGKPAGYLFHQLQNFRDGRRVYAPMARLLATLDDRYLQDIAGHFAQLELPHDPPPATPTEPAVLARGEQLARRGDPARDLPACTACHGPALTGVAPAVPGLLGLPRDYLNAQLGAWRTGSRRAHAPDCMAALARRLDPADVHAVAHWLAAQVVPSDARPMASPAGLPAPMPLRCGGVATGVDR
jgi:cytochrome c553